MISGGMRMRAVLKRSKPSPAARHRANREAEYRRLEEKYPMAKISDEEREQGDRIFRRILAERLAGEGDDLEVQLVNGLFVETVRLEDITEISFPAREETTSLPVIDVTKGYEQGK